MAGVDGPRDCRLGPLVLAAADLHAGRADPALPAVARRDPRVPDPADGPGRDQGRRLHGPARDPGADLREARPLQRLQLGVVLGDLHPAVHLAHRLHRAPHLAVRGPAARQAAGRPATAEPAARVHDMAHRGRAGDGPRGGPEAAEAAALSCGCRRGRRRRREGLPPGGRQPRLPHRADRDADRLRLGPALQVRGQQADRRGRRLRQHPHAVRRLQVREPLRHGRPGAVQLRPGQLQGHVRAERAQQGHPAHVRVPRHLQRGLRRQGEAADDQGQRAARHRRHEGLPRQPRVRARRHRAGRQG